MRNLLFPILFVWQLPQNLVALVIGLPSILHLIWFNRKRPSGKSCHDFYTERRAKCLAGLS